MTGTVVITGANRGIGLAHASRYAEGGWRVIATARDVVAATALRALSSQYPERVEVLALEVTDGRAVAALATALAGRTIDLLINNAGTFGPAGAPAGMAYQSLARMDYAIWRDILEVNLIAPFRLTVALLPALRRASRPVVVMMSSDLGSIHQNRQGQSYAYRSSKAGLNMVARGMAAEWPDVIVVALAPGWCRTDLGGAEAELDPAESVAAQQATLARLTLAESGRFLDRHGQVVPW